MSRIIRVADFAFVGLPPKTGVAAQSKAFWREMVLQSRNSWPSATEPNNGNWVWHQARSMPTLSAALKHQAQARGDQDGERREEMRTPDLFLYRDFGKVLQYTM
jgi:hypothetical protein